MRNQLYPTDVTDSQWNLIKELIPLAKPGGRPRVLDMRRVLNAILYVVVGGIKWRMLLREYPKWKSVYHYFRQWRDNGTWQRLHDTLRARVQQICPVRSSLTEGSNGAPARGVSLLSPRAGGQARPEGHRPIVRSLAQL